MNIIAIFQSIMIIIIISETIQCDVNGKIEGLCITKSSISESIPFCYKYLPNIICVPYFHSIWPEWTNTTIDQAVEKSIVQYIQKEFLSEIANIFDMTLINNGGCLDAYISFLCKMNFRACDLEKDQAFDICQSVCMSFVNKCQTYKTLCDTFPVNDCEK